MLVGVIVGRNILRIPTIAGEKQETVVHLVGDSIQALLTG